MKNDFITTFTSLSLSERAAFRQYIYYFHAAKKAVLQIFEHVAVSESNPKIIEDLLEFDYENTHNNLSDLKKWLIEFWTIQEVKSNSFEAQFFTLETLRKRKAKLWLSKKTATLQEKLKAHPSPDMGLALMKLRLTDADYFSIETDKLKNRQAQMQFLCDELDNFYIRTKLKYTAELESRKKLLKETYDARLLKDLLVLAETDDSLHPHIRHLYLPLLKLIKDESEVAYRELKSFLTHDKEHDNSEKLTILIYLLNFTAARQGKEPTIYYREYFDLAQIGIRKHLFTTAGAFPTGTFNNIVNAACYLEKYPWATQFVEDWSDKLNPDDVFIAKTFASARINFEQRKFEPAMDLLNQIASYKNTYFTLHIHILTARTYYELGRPTVAQTKYCNAFEKYVRTHATMKSDLKQNINNFIKILRFIINKKPKKQILKAIDNKGDIACYTWLKKKIDDLKE